MKRLSDYDKMVMKYCAGALIAAVLTVIIYLIVMSGMITEASVLGGVILLFAVMQFCVQLFFFLHVGRGAKPQLRLYSLVFVVGTVLIVVIGSIWIMKNLDYNMGMTGEQMHEYMLKENQKGF